MADQELQDVIRRIDGLAELVAKRDKLMAELEEYARRHGTTVSEHTKMLAVHEKDIEKLLEFRRLAEIKEAREDERDKALQANLNAIEKAIAAATAQTEKLVLEVKVVALNAVAVAEKRIDRHDKIFAAVVTLVFTGIGGTLLAWFSKGGATLL